jgi:hypothetical protein
VPEILPAVEFQAPLAEVAAVTFPDTIDESPVTVERKQEEDLSIDTDPDVLISNFEIEPLDMAALEFSVLGSQE